MTPTRPSRDRSDCRNLESGGQRALRLTGANHSELKETSLQDVPVKESRADISSSLKTRPAVLMSFFSACNKDPMKEKIRSFWPTCTVLFCRVNQTRWRRRSLLGHVDNQTSFLLVFVVYLNIHSFDLWRTFL